ncbi:MAG TPA: hypothetical protein VIL71_12355 [Spirillospora sp.]
MDLERELREAMAEHVAGTTAPPSLVADVKRRHRRRRARIHATVGAAAAAVAVAALVPAYQSFRAAPTGTSETARPADGASTLGQPGRPPAPGPSASPSVEEEPGTGPSRGPGTGTSEDGGQGSGGGGTGGAPESLPRWVAYVPGGLTVTGPCQVKNNAERETTTCTWRGTPGWLKVTIVRGSGITGPGDLVDAPGLPDRTTVRGAPAFVVDGPGPERHVSWLARPGVGVTVSAGGSVKDQLMRVAEGVRP